MRCTVTCCVLAFAAVFTACAAPMTLPKDFVELHDGGVGWRAITSDDARLRVRDLDDPTAGSVQFWADSLRHDLLQRGYESVASGEVKNREGGIGTWLEFGTNVQGERVGFFVALWVVPGGLFRRDRLRVVEFAAAEAVFRARLDAVRAALVTVGG